MYMPESSRHHSVNSAAASWMERVPDENPYSKCWELQAAIQEGKKLGYANLNVNVEAVIP